MASKKSEPTPPAPTHVLLLGDVYIDGTLAWHAGKVIRLTDQNARILDVEAVAYRAATARERAIAGFDD
jgi:hypothetical protein